MKEIILGALAILAIGITLALCRVAGKSDESLEHPDRIALKGDKHDRQRDI